MKTYRNAEIFFLFVFSTAVFAFYFYNQPAATYTGCLLCDGNQYLSMYHYFEGNAAEYNILFPYYSRAMVPWLASLFPWSDPLLSFQLVNLLFTLAGVAAIYLLWRRLEIPGYLMGIGMFWLLLHWTGIVRLNAMDPVTTDVPTYFFQALFVLLVIDRRFGWLMVLGPAAVLQRESILVLLMVLFVFAVVQNYLKNDEEKYPLKIIVSALALTIAVKYLFTLTLPPADADKSSLRLVLFYIKEVWMDPFKIIRWVTGIFMAYGALLMLGLMKVNRILLKQPAFLFLTVLSAVYLMLGIIAGGDSTRIVFLGFPFIMTWTLIALKDSAPVITGVALLLSAILMKLFSTIPDPGENFLSFAEWYPEFAPPAMVLVWGGYMVFCIVILYLTNRFIKVK